VKRAREGGRAEEERVGAGVGAWKEREKDAQ